MEELPKQEWTIAVGHTFLPPPRCRDCVGAVAQLIGEAGSYVEARVC